MTTPLLDFDALIAPIAGEQPAGSRLAPDVRKKMEDARKEFEPNPDDPSKPPIAKKPDWAAIVKLANDNLAKTSKDLLGAVRLVEALAKRDGFAGLRDGLKLLRLLTTDCWDRVHPVIEGPEDLEFRAGPFQWIADDESGAWFPTTVRNLPLVRVGGLPASLKDTQDGRRGEDPLSAADLRAAEPVTPETSADVNACIEELQTLDQALTDKMGDQAPSLASLRDVLTECQSFLKHLEVPLGEQAADASGQGQPGATGAAGPASSRGEVYRQLARLADDLSRMEPHSPIPDLLRWAVKLGGMPFRELIQELVSDTNALNDIRKRFGIKEAENPPAE